jgi:hypothetical protein
VAVAVVEGASDAAARVWVLEILALVLGLVVLLVGLLLPA